MNWTTEEGEAADLDEEAIKKKMQEINEMFEISGTHILLF